MRKGKKRSTKIEYIYKQYMRGTHTNKQTKTKQKAKWKTNNFVAIFVVDKQKQQHLFNLTVRPDSRHVQNTSFIPSWEKHSVISHIKTNNKNIKARSNRQPKINRHTV